MLTKSQVVIRIGVYYFRSSAYISAPIAKGMLAQLV